MSERLYAPPDVDATGVASLRHSTHVANLRQQGRGVDRLGPAEVDATGVASLRFTALVKTDLRAVSL